MYIQENSAEQPRNAPPDYSGHTYGADPPVPPLPPIPPSPAKDMGDESLTTVAGEAEIEQTQKSTPVGAFSGKGGKRGDFFGGLGLNGLFSRIPFLSSFAPPPRACGEGERKHSELWDWILLAVVALSLFNGKDDDVLPLLLLLLLWD